MSQLEVPRDRISFRVREIAELFGIGPSKIRAAIRSGALQALKLDSTVIVPREALVAWLSRAETFGSKEIGRT